jgi:hypothetical protein
MLVRRYAFARLELHKAKTDRVECPSCGNLPRVSWKYWLEVDSIKGSKNSIPGSFCNKDCLNSYYGANY